MIEAIPAHYSANICKLVFFFQLLGGTFGVIRVMPNIPCQVGQGASGMCLGRYATESSREEVTTIFSAVGAVTVVREFQMDGEYDTTLAFSMG